MALDLYVANNLDEAAVSRDAFSLGSQCHVSIMHHVSVNEFPMMYRMHDYYNDAQYGAHEINALLSEVTKLKNIVDVRSTAQVELNMIAAVCKNALDAQSGVYAVCD